MLNLILIAFEKITSVSQLQVASSLIEDLLFF